MNTKTALIILVIIILGAASIYFVIGKDTGPTPDPTPKTNQLEDSKAIPEGVKAIVDASNQFAFDLYNQFKDEEGNIFFSPYSISTAMAMVYEGAKGDTAQEIQSVFNFPIDDTVRQSSFASLFNKLNQPNPDFQLKVANALWAQADYQFLEDYLNILKTYYVGEANNVDFKNDTEASRQVINGWVENKTNKKIMDLFPKGLLNQSTRLVLTNAIYFKGTWVKQFEKANTKTYTFTNQSGDDVEVEMMEKTDDNSVFKYSEEEDFQILEIPYEGDKLSMLILLPRDNNPSALEGKLTPEKISNWRASLTESRVDVFLPKFTFKTKYLLYGNLADLGMPTAFSDQADFSGMDGTKNLSIQQVIHQAFVDVNEEGTEAVAATGIGFFITALEPTTIPIFRADHPFIFLIVGENNEILFLGRMSDPS